MSPRVFLISQTQSAGNMGGSRHCSKQSALRLSHHGSWSHHAICGQTMWKKSQQAASQMLMFRQKLRLCLYTYTVLTCLTGWVTLVSCFDPHRSITWGTALYSCVVYILFTVNISVNIMTWLYPLVNIFLIFFLYVKWESQCNFFSPLFFTIEKTKTIKTNTLLKSFWQSAFSLFTLL